VPSGLAATTLPLLALTSAGDHVLVTDSVYGPTRRFCNNHLTRLGVEVSYYDPLIGSGIEREMRPNTRAVFLESPGSLSFEVQDVSAIAAVAHSHGALVLLDNTWATPLNFRAFDHGVDVSMHAGTKYLGGHSDLLIGLIVGSKASFPRLHRLWTDTGVTASSDDLFSGAAGDCGRSAVRLDRRHQVSALHRAVATSGRRSPRSLHPALPGARGHELGSAISPAPADCLRA
jgi:cystathionine beta-lyase